MRTGDRVDARAGGIVKASRPWCHNWAAYAAWALIFGAVHLYWLLGRGEGLPPDTTVRDSTALLVVAVVAISLCAAGALLALALAGGWGRRLPRWLLLTAGWGAAAVRLTHFVPTILADLALALRLQSPQLSANDRSIMYLYEPWFFAGGLCFATATWLFQRRTRRQAPCYARSRFVARLDAPAGTGLKRAMGIAPRVIRRLRGERTK